MNLLDIRFYLSIFWRRFPYFLVVAVLIASAGITVALVLPPSYRAVATIQVEGQQIPDNLASTTVGTRTSQQIQIIQQRVMSRNSLLDMARRLDLFADQPELSSTDVVGILRETIRMDTIGSFNGATSSVMISYTSSEPEKTAAVANEIAAMILEENVRIRTDQATDTLEFFSDEVGRLSGELDRVSADILEFKTANEGALPDSLDYRRGEQSRMQERLLQLDREKTDLLETRGRLIELAQRTGSRGQADVPPTEEEVQLEDLKDTLQQRLIVMSETNPNIVLLRNRINALQEIVDAQRQESGADFLEEYSEMDVQLAQIDGRLEFIDSEQARLEQQIAELNVSIQQTPEVEIALTGLERQLSTLQAQYNTAVANRAAAATGERIELLSKGERFSITEQAIVPGWPESPNRKLLAAASVVAGMGAGLGLVFLLELINRAIRRPVEITQKLGIQPFGTVPYVRTRREKLVKRAIIATVLIVFAVAVPVGIWALHTYYMPLDLLIERLVEKLGLEPYLGALL